MNFEKDLSIEDSNSKTAVIVTEKGYERIRVTEGLGSTHCAECGAETRFYSCSLTAPLCSHECVDKAWVEYFENLSAALNFEQTLIDGGMSQEQALIETLVAEGAEPVRNVYGKPENTEILN